MTKHPLSAALLVTSLILLNISCGFPFDHHPNDKVVIEVNEDGGYEPEEEPDEPRENNEKSDDQDREEQEVPDEETPDDSGECAVIRIDPRSFDLWSVGIELNTYSTYVDDTYGGEYYDDKLSINFREPVRIASYNLDKGDPPSFSGIGYDDVFIMLEEDYYKGSSGRKYLNAGGSLEITDYDPLTSEIKGKISVKLIQALFESVYTTTNIQPVNNGRCVKIENADFDTFCRPDCTGKLCGNDGCGGSCGDCGNEKTCNAEQTKCVPYDCKKLEFGEVHMEKNFYEASVSGNKAGASSLHDRLRISFYDKSGNYRKTLSPAVSDLGSKTNSDYATCTECVTLHEDLSSNDPSPTTMFFQNKGTLEITATKENSIESKGKASFRLVETEIDRHYHSVPVDGGRCYEGYVEWDTFSPDLPENPDEDETEDMDIDETEDLDTDEAEDDDGKNGGDTDTE